MAQASAHSSPMSSTPSASAPTECKVPVVQASSSSIQSAAASGSSADGAAAAIAALSTGRKSAVAEVKASPMDCLRYQFSHACLHGGPSDYGTRNANGTLDARDYDEVYECLQSCFDRIYPHPRPRQTTSHACTIECPHIEHRGDTFVCCISGFVHHCMEYTCEYATVPSGGHSRVCPITCKSYPCYYEYSFEQMGHTDGQHMRDTRVTVNKKPARDHLSIATPSPTNSSPSPSPSPTSSASSPSFSRLSGHKRKVVALPMQATYLAVAAIIGRFTLPLKPLECSIRENLAVEILALLSKIESTGISPPPSWTLESATFTVLFAFTNASMTMGDTVWVRFHMELVGALRPLRECVCAILECPYKSHTVWLSFLGTTMSAFHRKKIADAEAAIAAAAAIAARKLELQNAKPVIYCSNKSS